MLWSEENSDLVKKLWNEGQSASRIAMRIPGYSRNAVIGKVYRLGLSHRRTTSRAREAVPRKKKINPNPVPPVRTKKSPTVAQLIASDAEHQAVLQRMATSPDVARVTCIDDLENHHCRYIVGDVRTPGWGWCGDKKLPGLSYCAGHAVRCTAGPVASKPARPERYDYSIVPSLVQRKVASFV